MSSSSTLSLLAPLNEAVERLQEKVMEGLPWAIAIAMTAIVLWITVPWLASLWWYRKNPLAGKIQRRRHRLSELFGLTIKTFAVMGVFASPLVKQADGNERGSLRNSELSLTLQFA